MTVRPAIINIIIHSLIVLFRQTFVTSVPFSLKRMSILILSRCVNCNNRSADQIVWLLRY